jgi:hypothetical protein
VRSFIVCSCTGICSVLCLDRGDTQTIVSFIKLGSWVYTATAAFRLGLAPNVLVLPSLTVLSLHEVPSAQQPDSAV